MYEGILIKYAKVWKQTLNLTEKFNVYFLQKCIDQY